MNELVYKTILDYNLINKNDKIVVAISGGADSMALLDFLLNKMSKYNLKLIACHINHMLRDSESLRDELFVKEYCNKNNIILESVRIDINKISNKNKMGIEQCAREERYKFLYKISNIYKAKIATAHTLSDKTETFIMNFTRGSSLNGLCSIPYKRDNIIRPFINCTRYQIENYCKDNDIEYITDSSNNETIYTRNKIRLYVLPILKEINPNIENNIKNLTYSLSEDNKYLNNIAELQFKNIKENEKIDINKIIDIELPILTRIINIFLKENNIDSSNKNIYSIVKIIKSKKGKINISKDKYICIENDTLYIKYYNENNKSNIYDYFEYEIKNNSIIRIDDIYYKFVISKSKKIVENKQISKNISISYIDYDKIVGNIIFRQKKPSDKIKLSKLGYNKSIKKLFNESKIPIKDRYKLPVLTDNLGVIWLDKFGCNIRISPDKNTKNYLIIIKYFYL